jgi:hypothetical protein
MRRSGSEFSRKERSRTSATSLCNWLRERETCCNAAATLQVPRADGQCEGSSFFCCHAHRSRPDCTCTWSGGGGEGEKQSLREESE